MIARAEIILKEKNAEIFYDSETQIITAKWIGFQKLEDVQRGCDLINQHVKTHKLTKHISDHTKLKVLSKEVQEYLTQVGFVEVEKLGLEKIAVLVSEDIFAQATVDNVNLKGSVGKLKIHTFNSLSQCERWLKEA
jgi:nitrogen regulatory protein PII-like uncharacterized protein